jgi:hypothetical protein
MVMATKSNGSGSNRVGSIMTPVDPYKQPAKVDRETIGTGTTDSVPGHTTRLSYSPTEISNAKKSQK